MMTMIIELLPKIASVQRVVLVLVLVLSLQPRESKNPLTFQK